MLNQGLSDKELLTAGLHWFVILSLLQPEHCFPVCKVWEMKAFLPWFQLSAMADPPLVSLRPSQQPPLLVKLSDSPLHLHLAAPRTESVYPP